MASSFPHTVVAASVELLLQVTISYIWDMNYVFLLMNVVTYIISKSQKNSGLFLFGTILVALFYVMDFTQYMFIYPGCCRDVNPMVRCWLYLQCIISGYFVGVAACSYSWDAITQVNWRFVLLRHFLFYAIIGIFVL